MAGFLIVGGFGLLLLVASLLFGDVFEGLFDAVDIDAGSGVFSAPVIGAFLAAFGFGAALMMSASDVGAVLGAAVGAAAGLGFGLAAWVITRALMRMATDPPVRLTDLVGKSAMVVTRIPENGFGEVSLVHLGQRMKFNAKATVAIPGGTEVVVLAAMSSSSVLVEPAVTFWAEGGSS